MTYSAAAAMAMVTMEAAKADVLAEAGVGNVLPEVAGDQRGNRDDRRPAGDLLGADAQPVALNGQAGLQDGRQQGGKSGDLDATLPPAWLVSACLALGRAAEEQVKAGRMTIEEASHTFLRLLGMADSAQR